MNPLEPTTTTIEGGSSNGHIRCLSVVPLDLAQLLAELEAEEKFLFSEISAEL